MDALLALREAIVHGAAITEQGDSILVHNGLGEPLLLSRAAKTPFKSSGGGHLTVEALYLQFLYKDLKHADFWKQYDARGLNKSLAVLVQDKEFVLQYLTGAYDGADHVDRDFVSTVSGVTRGASSTAAPSAPISASDATEAAPAEADSGAALAAMLHETALRTRVTILDAPGFKNFSEFVFEFFKRQEIAPAGGSGASKPPAGSKRSREEKAPPAGSEARKQVEVGNPIIIVPSAPTSMVTLHNVKQLLELGTYVPPAAAKAAAGSSAMLTTVSVTHVRGATHSSSGAAVSSIPTTFDVIDNVSKLSPADWKRVVAVFVLGPDWQFKGWTLGKPASTVIRPVDVFDYCLAFHLHQDDSEPHVNVKKWPVNPLPVNKSKRHLDIVAVNKFWGMLDAYMLSKRQYLLRGREEEDD